MDSCLGNNTHCNRQPVHKQWCFNFQGLVYAKDGKTILTLSVKLDLVDGRRGEGCIGGLVPEECEDYAWAKKLFQDCELRRKDLIPLTQWKFMIHSRTKSHKTELFRSDASLVDTVKYIDNYPNSF